MGRLVRILGAIPDKFWRRIGCIAYEDVGVASLERRSGLRRWPWLANGTTPRAPANG
jgi:hypothetical protein